MIAFVVVFLVVMINGYHQSVYILEQSRFFLFPDGNRALYSIRKPLVIVIVQNTISPT